MAIFTTWHLVLGIQSFILVWEREVIRWELRFIWLFKFGGWVENLNCDYIPLSTGSPGGFLHEIWKHEHSKGQFEEQKLLGSFLKFRPRVSSHTPEFQWLLYFTPIFQCERDSVTYMIKYELLTIQFLAVTGSLRKKLKWAFLRDSVTARNWIVIPESITKVLQSILA